MSTREIAADLAKALRARASLIERMSKDPVIEVNTSNLDKILSSHDLVFLYFTAEWCGPCITFLSTIREVAATLEDPRILWSKVDVDKSFTIADRYGVNHIPSMLILYKGRVIDSIVGTMSKDKLEKKIKGYIDTYLK
ncbi:MAG: thioredoxin family protein [Desulfurococcales archaeon]|nr:thioredoxin family protein [Desulfurococcales archaeon]MCE4605247.1 thioredoxin family protein [Desulfurococcales archaeon]